MPARRKTNYASRSIAVALSLALIRCSIHGVTAEATVVSQHELNQDVISLRQMSKTKDVAKFDALATQLQNKWLNRDTSSYLAITSNICEDLSNYDFGVKNVKAVRRLDQKFAAIALANAKLMPLGMRAFLTIQIAQPTQAANDKDWPSRRHNYAEQVLSIWQQLQQQADQLLGEEPTLPPVTTKELNSKMYPNGIVLLAGPRVDPSYIKDPTMRSRYQLALEKYDAYFYAIQEKQNALNSLRWYKLVAPTNLVLMYANGPDGTEELTLLLKKYDIPSQEQSSILKSLNSEVLASPIT